MRNRLTSVAVATVFATALIAISSERVVACRCAPLDEAAAMAEADVAFEGVVRAFLLHPRPRGVPATYAFAVEQPLQGPIERGQVTVATPESDAACGIEFAVGQRWVIYATATDATTLATTACSGSHLIGERPLPTAAAQGGASPPFQVIGLGAVVAALVILSAWAFRRRGPMPG